METNTALALISRFVTLANISAFFCLTFRLKIRTFTSEFNKRNTDVNEFVQIIKCQI